MKRKVVGWTLAGLAAASSPALGAIYTFSAGGGFAAAGIGSGTGTATVDDTGTGGTLIVAGAGGTATLTYTGVPTTTENIDPGGIIDLGTLSLNVTGDQVLPVTAYAELAVDVDFTTPSSGEGFGSELALDLSDTNAGITDIFNPETETFYADNPADDFSITVNGNPIQLADDSSVELTGTIDEALSGVPEPASGAIVLGGMAVLGWRRRRRVSLI